MLDLTNYKKIAIAGSHNIGKTTLAKRLADTTGLVYIPEVARELLNMSKNWDWRNADEKQILAFEKAIYHSHLFFISLYGTFISDRSVFDIAAYCLYHDKQRLTDYGNCLIKDELEKKRYDAILFYVSGYNQKDEAGEYIHKILDGLLTVGYMKGLYKLFLINKGDIIKYNNVSLVV